MKLGLGIGGALCLGVVLLFGNCSRDFGDHGGEAGSGGIANDAGAGHGDSGASPGSGGTTQGGAEGSGGSNALPVSGQAGSPDTAEGGTPALNCMPDEPACEQECTPSTRFCSGSAVRLCADDGLSSEEVEACGTQTTCEAGECLPWVCPQPGESYCEGQSIKRCAANGLSSEVLETCVDQTCLAKAGRASCQGVCAPNQTRCLNNSVQACRAIGDYGPAVACDASTPFCSAGACTATPS